MIFVDEDGEPVTPQPPCKHEWKVRHVDSVCVKCGEVCEHGEPVSSEMNWDNPYNYDQRKHAGLVRRQIGETQYLMCVKCGRKFQLLHPVTAEAIVRDMQQEIDRLEGLFANV